MTEYIEKEAAIKKLRGEAVAKYPMSFSFGLFAAADEIASIPAANVREVPDTDVGEFAKDTNVRSNADRIRSMSDEELALWIGLRTVDSRELTYKGWLDWLKSPVEVDNA